MNKNGKMLTGVMMMMMQAYIMLQYFNKMIRRLSELCYLKW